MKIRALCSCYQVGTVAYIKQVVKASGQCCSVSWWKEPEEQNFWDWSRRHPICRAEIVLTDEEEEELPQAMLEAMYRSIRELFHTYCTKGGKIGKELAAQILELPEDKGAD